MREPSATAAGAAEGGHQQPDVLFVMPRLSFLRFFQPPLELMIERGFNVRLLLERAGGDDHERAWLEWAQAQPNFVCDAADHFRSDPLRESRIALRIGMEYVRRMAPKYENRIAGRPRERLSRAPRTIRYLVALRPVRRPRLLGSLYRILAAVDRALPVQEAAAEYVRGADPDLVAVCDKGHPGSLSSAYVRAARRRGIPTAICVASWDNLTNRQRTPVVPDALLVWNERQREEAVDFHGIPPERVAVTGAPRFDEWFTWRPRERAEFLARVGLAPDKPVLLWVGSAINHSEIPEAELVGRWIAALRSSDDPALREVGVIARPHPERLAEWLEADFSSFGDVALWPREGMTFPLDAETKADYFDSIYHAAAVVGINTSAMIEASIVGRPVLSFLSPEFHDSQLATFHFSYLLEPEGGPVRLAPSLDDHLTDVTAILAAGDAGAPERARRFVVDFVRPHGLERPATPIFVETLERLAAARVAAEDDGTWMRAVRPLVTAATLVVRARRTVRNGTRRLVRGGRRLVKRTFRFVRRCYLWTRRRARLLRKAVRRRWWRYGQPVLSRVLKIPDRVRLGREDALDAVKQFRRRQPPGALRPDWSDLLYLYRIVRERRPATVLEFGSGCSTAVIATALLRNGGGRLWSVEGDEEWARATERALPEELRRLVTVTHCRVVEDDRDVPGWSYVGVPDVTPDLIYLDGPPHTPERKVAFDVLDLEHRFPPGFVLVVDGRGRNAYYLRDRLTRRYRFEEQAMRWRHMYRFVFELLDSEPAEHTAPEARDPAPAGPVRS